MANNKIKKTWTLLPETVAYIEEQAEKQERYENTIVDRLVREAIKLANK